MIYGPPRIGLYEHWAMERTNPIMFRSENDFNEHVRNETVKSYNHESMYNNSNRIEPVDLWVTVFGFNPNDITEVIDFFTFYCGRVIDKKYPPQRYNWIEIKFERPYQVFKALKYNGKIINGSTMIGVVKNSSEPKETMNWSHSGYYDTTKPLSINNPMVTNWNTPTNKSNGLMTRFFELIFGL